MTNYVNWTTVTKTACFLNTLYELCKVDSTLLQLAEIFSYNIDGYISLTDTQDIAALNGMYNDNNLICDDNINWMRLDIIKNEGVYHPDFIEYRYGIWNLIIIKNIVGHEYLAFNNPFL